MSVVRYKSDHYQAICSWYHARGLEAPPSESLSDLGYIVDNRVAGWLYVTNSNVALIECVISNPHTIPSLRRQSLQKLAGLLVDAALSMGYSIIKADTIHPSIEQICRDMGFIELKMKTFVLNEDCEENNTINNSVYNSLFNADE